MDDNDATLVGGSQRRKVAGERTTTVYESFSESVGGNQAVTIAGHRELTIDATATESVGAASALTIGAAYAINVGADETVAVSDRLERHVGGDHREWIGAGREASVEGDDHRQIGGKDVQDVHGDLALSTEGDVEERVGQAIGMQASQAIAWSARGFRLEADTLNLEVGGKRLLRLAHGKVSFTGASVSINGQSIALKGFPIAKLGPGAPPAAPPRKTEADALAADAPRVALRITDQHGNPLPNVRVRIEMPDGSVRVVRSRKDGVVVASAPRHGRVNVMLPDHDASIWDRKK